MTDNDHLDGNAAGGILIEAFGREMTDHEDAAPTAGRSTNSAPSSPTPVLPGMCCAAPTVGWWCWWR